MTTVFILCGAGLSLAASLQYEQEVLADNPVALWRLGETSGTVLVDSSGNGHHGTYSNAMLGVAGVGPASDFAARFNGTNSHAVVPDHSAFNFLDYTLSAWIMLENPTGSAHRIISQQDVSQHWLLHVRGASDEWRLTSFSSLDGIAGVSHGPDLNDNLFHHVAITRDTGAGLVSFYVDGGLVGTHATSSTATYNIASNVFIGALNGTSQFFPGVIDEIALFNTALSADRIEAHFVAGTFVQPLIIPEPSTALLLALGAAALVNFRRRRA